MTNLFAGPTDPVSAAANRVGSLLRSANLRVDGADTEQSSEGAVRWPLGFSFDPEACDAGELQDICAEGSAEALDNPDFVTYRPAVLEVMDECSTFGNPDSRRERRQERAVRVLLACESKRVEEELWSGTLAQAAGYDNKFLTDGNATLPEGGAALGYVTALAQLEHGLADCMCGPGMIHARPDTVTLWIANNLIRRQGDLLTTELGTIVVAGAGYDGTGAVGAAPSADGAWAFATSIVEVRRGVVFSAPQEVIRATNSLRSYAARPVAATWGCCQIGVRVSHTAATSVTGS